MKPTTVLPALTCALCLAAVPSAGADEPAVYRDKSAPPEARVADLAGAPYASTRSSRSSGATGTST